MSTAIFEASGMAQHLDVECDPVAGAVGVVWLPPASIVNGRVSLYHNGELIEAVMPGPGDTVDAGIPGAVFQLETPALSVSFFCTAVGQWISV